MEATETTLEHRMLIYTLGAFGDGTHATITADQ